MFDNKEKTNIEALGEFGLINHLTKNIESVQKSTIKGVGDDAAVLDNGHTIAQPLGFLHQVCGQENGLAAVADAAHQVPDGPPGLRV